MKLTNILKNQVISGDMQDFRSFLLIDCEVNGDMNKIGGMLGGSLNGDMNAVEYIKGTQISGDMNKFKYSFTYEDEIKKEEDKSSSLSPQIREALEISETAVKFQKQARANIFEINNMTAEYYKKWGKWDEKVAGYLRIFYNKAIGNEKNTDKNDIGNIRNIAIPTDKSLQKELGGHYDFYTYN